MEADCHGMPAEQSHRARARDLGIGGVATLMALLALGAFAGTASAHTSRLAAGITTSTETTTSAPPTTSDATTATSETTTAEETTTEDDTRRHCCTVQLTTTTTQAGLGPGGAAVVGAAAASSTDDSDTQWGWIAFGILAAAVIVFGIVWLVRRSRRPLIG